MRRVLIPLLLAAMLARPAMAHGVDVELRGDGQASVVFRYTDGTPMAPARYRIFAPESGDLPSETGDVDRIGAVPLSTDRDGVWRVEVEDRDGHAARARIRVTKALPALAAQTLPDWLAACSLCLNVMLAAPIFASWKRRPCVRTGTAPGAFPLTRAQRSP